MAKSPDDELSVREVRQRSDELLRHFISRPPQPHASHHPGKTRTAKATAGRRKDRKVSHRAKLAPVS